MGSLTAQVLLKRLDEVTVVSDTAQRAQRWLWDSSASLVIACIPTNQGQELGWAWADSCQGKDNGRLYLGELRASRSSCFHSLIPDWQAHPQLQQKGSRILVEKKTC